MSGQSGAPDQDAADTSRQSVVSYLIPMISVMLAWPLAIAAIVGEASMLQNTGKDTDLLIVLTYFVVQGLGAFAIWGLILLAGRLAGRLTGK